MNKTRKEHGFTLMELGIVISILAILGAVIVPDIIESMNMRMVKKAASDITILHDAARAYYTGVDSLGTAPSMWPGMDNPVTCTLNMALARERLLSGAFITGGGAPGNPINVHPGGDFLTNPWQEQYELVVMSSNIAGSTGCMFGIVTIIPTRLENYFINQLPQAFCRADACQSVATIGPPGPGFSLCCSFISKPGIGSPINPCEGSPHGSVIISDGPNICCGPAVGDSC